MFEKPNCPVIAVEEHYWDAELSKTYVGLEFGRPGPQMDRLFDLGALRLKEMDEVGIDIQVISHGAPRRRSFRPRARPRSSAAPTTGWPPPAPPIPSASRHSRPCLRTIRRPPPTSSSAP